MFFEGTNFEESRRGKSFMLLAKTGEILCVLRRAGGVFLSTAGMRVCGNRV